MQDKDNIYKEQIKNIPPFEFNDSVAHSFDDMASRSIPFYSEVERMSASLTGEFFQDGSLVYDLGCSTGTCSIHVYNELEKLELKDFKIIGIDNSKPMCNEAKTKIKSIVKNPSKIEILHQDILNTDIKNASVVILNYTLQFIPPLKRETLLEKIYNGLNHNGILIVSDKTHQNHTDISRTFIDKYYDYKRSHEYSDLEISQKREALENVLIPYTIKEEEKLFTHCGFNSVDIFFSWYNFTSFICVKR